MDPAVLVVSFGTTHTDTLRENIARTEAAIAGRFPGCALYRAFTSGIVRTRLREKLDIRVDSVEEALARIAAHGHGEAVIQPTLVIPGEEYDRLRASAGRAPGGLRCAIGQPLLRDDGDLDGIAGVLREAYPTPEDTVLLAMGHGTDHSANDLYERLAEKLRRREGPPMRLCTVEGTPTFADAARELAAMPQRKALLVPLMLVAGEHAKEDMAGERPESLRSLLVREGFRVSCIVRGLGQLPSVRELYAHRALEAAKTL